MANEKQWSSFLTVENQPWFSEDTKAELETYTVNVGLVEKQRAEIDAEREALAAIPLANGANGGKELETVPARTVKLKTDKLKALNAENGARSNFKALIESAMKDAGAETIRLTEELAATEAALAAWLEAGPNPEIGGYVAPVDSAGQLLPQRGSWTYEFRMRHPRVQALRAAIEDCSLPWAGDFIRRNDDNAEATRQQMQAMHAAMLAV